VKLIKKGLIKKGKVLDICCGADTNSIYLAKNGFLVTAIDISVTALHYARKESKKEKSHINFMRLNFVHLSFRSEIFDFIFDMG
jgi:2-polyprenyl-3-methyl-5-hydroxy-6-metoxy-1,4-benzoquinol methylase